jgi:hypothetical protein
LTFGSISIEAPPRPARLLHCQEEAHRHRHDEEIDQHGAEPEKDRRGDEEGQEGAAFMPVEAWSYELVDLVGDHREGDEQRPKRASFICVKKYSCGAV